MSKHQKTVAVHVMGIPEDLFERMVAIARQKGVGVKRSDVVRFFAVQGLEHVETEDPTSEKKASVLPADERNMVPV